MMTELDVKYEKICKKNNYDPERGEQNKKGKNNSNSTSLAMLGYKGCRGRCHFCGNFGHKQAYCPYRNSERTQKLGKNHNKWNQNDQKDKNSNSTNNNTNDYLPPRRQGFHGRCNHCRK